MELQMGMPTAFTNKAVFSALCDRDPAWIQGVRQNVRLDVTQRGTKAEAVTVVPVTGYTSNIPLSFYANHTFMYVIREISTGAILFMGVYDGD
ncbi:MAG: hypothetical protein IJQ35_10630 [Bacteroidales bacterium]|nr:hypothetical protein [Bacteroidales bacterium]